MKTRIDLGGKAAKELQNVPRGFRSTFVEALVELFSEQVGFNSLPVTAFSSPKTLKTSVKSLLKQKLGKKPVQTTSHPSEIYTEKPAEKPREVDPETLKILKEVQAEEQQWEEMKKEEEERRKRLKKQQEEAW